MTCRGLRWCEPCCGSSAGPCWRWYDVLAMVVLVVGYGCLVLFPLWRPLLMVPICSSLLSSFFSRAHVSLCSNLSLCLSWLCRYWRQAACVSPGTDSACSCHPCPMCPQSQSMLAFREWTERVIIIIDTLWPSRQVRALRFESGLNVKRLRVGGKRFR